MGFKKDFIWGGASASYQIEGAYNEDGRGLSVWDTFCRRDGAIADKSSGETACDHYHRFKEDVALMKEMGLKAYRFSISWTRVMPDGAGAVNEKGLDFYSRLTDELLAAGITPYATLFHWDYPNELYKRGGWLNPDSPQWLAQYTAAVVQRLGDRVKHYFTLNEPQCVTILGHGDGSHAPGLKLPLWDQLTVAHNLLLGHGLATKAIRANAPKGLVGYAPVCTGMYPASGSAADTEAARAAFFSTQKDTLFWSNTFWNDAVFKGSYPAEAWEIVGEYMPALGAGDMDLIAQPLDFLAFNLYYGYPITTGVDGKPTLAERPAGHPKSAFNWPVTPEALYWAAKNLYERYRKPLIVSENGMSCHDTVSIDGKVHDPNRIDYTHRYLRSLRRAAEEGADAAGYFHWCVTDNFEWARGYMERFGLIYCDFATQQRILKDSAWWYKGVIAANGANL